MRKERPYYELILIVLFSGVNLGDFPEVFGTGLTDIRTPAVDQSDPPNFSMAGGIYSSSVDVALSGTGETLIYYTLDGTIPLESSAEYTSPLLLDATTVVRSVAIEPGKTPSEPITHTYFINEPVNLPFFSIVTDPDNLFSDATGIYVTGTNGIAGACDPVVRNLNQDWERPVNIEFYEKDGTPGFNQGAGIKIFGGCSRTRFPQKSFSLFARKMYGKGSFDYPLFPDRSTERFESFLLRSAADDQVRTMFNDAFTAYVLKENMNLDYMAYRPVVVFINGQYWGIHNLREKVNEHYLKSNFGVAEDDINLLQGNASIVFGSNSDYNQMMSFVANNSLSDNENYAAVAGLMDVGQFIDYEIANIHLAEVDWPGNNIKFWKANHSPYDKWRWILFDRDQTFQGYRASTDALSLATASSGPNWPNPPWSTLLLRRLLENDDFKARFLQTYAYHLSTTFEPQRVGNILNQFKQGIENEIPRHITRWGGQLDADKSETWPAPTFNSVAQWESNIEAVRSFLPNREPMAIQHLNSLFGVAARSTITIISSDPAAGRVKLFEKTLSSISTADYFNGVPLLIRAFPNIGYRFVHWEVEGEILNSEDLQLVPSGHVNVVAYFELSSPPQPIVINEINYHSSGHRNSGDWVELYNPNDFSISLSGWYLKDSNDDNVYSWKEGDVIAAKGYRVICESIDDFKSVFPSVANSTGGMGFNLSNGGDMVRLFGPGDVLMDSVNYHDESPWPELADGKGSSLELIDHTLNNSLAESWRASATAGTPGDYNDENIVGVEEEVALDDIYPNPMSDAVFISYSLKNAGRVRIKLTSVLGQWIVTLLDEDQQAGHHEMEYHMNQPDGIYVIVLESVDGAQIHKILIAR